LIITKATSNQSTDEESIQYYIKVKMNRFLAILVMMVSLQIVAAMEGENEVFLIIDEDEDEDSFDEIK
jgi:hypothetical protein